MPLDPKREQAIRAEARRRGVDPDEAVKRAGAMAGMTPTDKSGAEGMLKAAIARHERHMNGTEATDERSQQKMMDEMKAALAALGEGAGAQAARPTLERLLIGVLPFVRVRELRSIWLGLDERLPDDELSCGEFQLKYGGGAAPAPAAPESAE
jgi:hypothetical protein